MHRFPSLILSSCLFAAACGGPAGPGGDCDPTSAGSCEERLVCQADADGADVCQIPLGGECILESDPSHCVVGAECAEVTEVVDGTETMVGRCYLGRGSLCDPNADEQCSPDLQCAPMEDGTSACQLPVAIRGRVLASVDMSAIAGAQVIALDETPTAVTDVSISELDGTYELRLPIVRNADGTPQLGPSYTLRASADGFLTFPGGIRQAIPVSSTLAVESAEGWIIMGTLTDIVLVEVEDPTAPRVSISGHVIVEADATLQAGVLVVADLSASGARGISALSDRRGAYTIFNVAPGEYTVRGYRGGLQLTPQTVTAADADLVDVDLVASDAALSTLSGTIDITDPGTAPGVCDATTIILAVESTFDELLGRGELPPGLRAPPLPEAPSITGGSGWTISGIPDGRYVVLAAFENDFCVRDPDTCIAGTGVVRVELPADAGSLTEAFKVTGALETLSPGAEAPEAVSSPPTLQWEGDASDVVNHVEVFDAYGDLVWSEMPAATTNAVESLAYGGPFETGMYYQFRATSIRMTPMGQCPISRTEDLRGVFFVP